MNWFRAKFQTKCEKCRDEIFEGEWACYNRDKELLCGPCGREEEEDAN